jgi:hypothetical protein
MISSRSRSGCNARAVGVSAILGIEASTGQPTPSIPARNSFSSSLQMSSGAPQEHASPSESRAFRSAGRDGLSFLRPARVIGPRR